MGDVPNLTVEILKQIRDDVGQLRNEVRAEIGEVRDEIGSFRAEVNKRFDRTDARFEAVEGAMADMSAQLMFLVKNTTNLGKRQSATQSGVNDLSKRVDRLEVHTGLKKPST